MRRVVRPATGTLPTLSSTRRQLLSRWHAAACCLTTSSSSPLVQLHQSRRAASTSPAAPQRKTAWLYYDHVFPIRMAIWDIRFLFSKMEQETVLERLRAAVPKDDEIDLKVESVVPRDKDGGAFVKLSFVPTAASQPSSTRPPGEQSAEEEQEMKPDEPAALELRKSLRRIEREMMDALRSGTSSSHAGGGTQSGGRRWFSWLREGKVFLVRGTPWLEDLNRFPYNTIKVEFASGPEIPQEELYGIFRRYGRIHDIYPQPASNKDVPRYALISYVSMRSAAAARNCMHAAQVRVPLSSSSSSSSSSSEDSKDVPSTTLRILYGERERAHYVRDWLASHPRLVLPAVVALIGAISYAIFDPVRTLAVKARISGALDVRQYRALTWLRSETIGRLGLDKKGHGGGFGAGASDADDDVAGTAARMTGIERDRQDAKETLENWLGQLPDSFVVVSGPRGAGKSTLVRDVLRDRRNVLTLDCAKIVRDGRASDARLVAELAGATGYWPQFTFLASASHMIDLASVGLIGQKAGFSSSVETQLKQILEVTTVALKKLADEAVAKQERALERAEYVRSTVTERERFAHQLQTDGLQDGRIACVAGNGVMSELGFGIEPPREEGEYTVMGPHSSGQAKVWACTDASEVDGMAQVDRAPKLPCVVLTGFATKGDARQDMLWDVLAEWAAVLVENQVAHVIFASDSIAMTKPLARALPSKPFNTIALADAPPDASVQYIATKLEELGQSLSPDERPAVAKLGGRQTDLELLVQKVRSGQNVSDAVDDLVARNATELRKNIFGDDVEESKALKWKRTQAWTLVKSLADAGKLKYADVLVNVFKNDEQALRALEQSGLLQIHYRNGRPSTITPGKPVYRSSFERLISDGVFRATMDLEANTAALSAANASVDDAMKELVNLTQLLPGANTFILGGAAPKEVVVRVQSLLDKARAGQETAAKLNAEAAELKKILKSEE